MSVADAQLQVVDGLLLFHEVFLGYDPGGTDRGEIAPFFLIFRGAVGSHRHGQQVFVGIVVGDTPEERSTPIGGSIVAGRQGFGLCLGEIQIFVKRTEKALARAPQRAPVLVANRGSEHGGQIVLSKAVLVGQRIVEGVILPVITPLVELRFSRVMSL